MQIAPNGLTVKPVTGIPTVNPGDDVSQVLVEALERSKRQVETCDVLVIAQKIVSKAENAFVRLDDVTPGDRAIELSETVGKDPRLVEVILRSSVRIVRSVPGVLITETHHGFICANAGVDASNGLGEGTITLLPEDPDRSAREIRDGIGERLGMKPSVIISDSFNRPWRQGSINVAIGTAGFKPLFDGRGTVDDAGHILRTTLVSLADEIASAAQLVIGESGRVPAAIISGLMLEPSEEGSATLLREPDRDLFR